MTEGLVSMDFVVPPKVNGPGPDHLVLVRGAQTIARTNVCEKSVPPRLCPVLVLARVNGRFPLVVPESVPTAELGPAPPT